jgi:putative glutamine amidotransferase
MNYERAILAAGGIPVIAPATHDPLLLAESVRRTDGVLLTGGDDINPGLYAKKITRSLRKTVNPTPDGGLRDLRELILIGEIFRQRKAVLAICRGHQLLNVAFGARLVVDIRSQLPGALNHRRPDRAFETVHEITVTPGSLFGRICGRRRLGVNSTHHQGVTEPANPFIATARSSDGLVEVMELRSDLATDLPFLLGVQFHPERLVGKGLCFRRIFSTFVRSCKLNSSR